MSPFTALRLRVVDWLTGWLPDPYQPAAFAEQDDDVLSDCGMADGERRLIGAVMQAQAEQAAAFEARTADRAMLAAASGYDLAGWTDREVDSLRAALTEQGDVRELTEAETARLAPFDCYPDCDCMPGSAGLDRLRGAVEQQRLADAHPCDLPDPTVEPVPTDDDGTDYGQALADLTESRRMWADLADAERCHHCPPSVCNGVPGRKTLTAADRADIAEDQRHVRLADGAGEV